MPAAIPISDTVRRRFILGKQGLWPGRRWQGRDGVDSALRAVEAVQVDPVTVVAQSHDLVLWGRVAGYRPDDLDSLLYTDRQFFDYGGTVMIYPMAELPFYRPLMERRKGEERWLAFAQANPGLLDAVRQAIRSRGPLRNRDFAGNAVDHYRGSKDTALALYYLWLTGELMTHSRQGKERVYDFLENVAPVHLQRTASPEDAAAFHTRKAVSESGLVSERDFHNILKGATGRAVPKNEAAATLSEYVAAGVLAPLKVEGERHPVYCLADDLPLLEQLSAAETPPAWAPVSTTTLDEVVFLAPLERVSARGRAARLFGFDYIWEIYKPAAKRQYGPYTMPILYGDRLVGRLDARVDRPARQLVVNGLWLEEWFEGGAAFAQALARGLHNLASFLQVSAIDAEAVAPAALRREINRFPGPADSRG